LARHHTFGRSVLLATLFIDLATWHCRTWKALALSAAGLVSHLISDAYFTRMDVYLLWPFSTKGHLIPGSYELVASANTYLACLSYVSVVALAVHCKRTPVDLFSPALDRRIASFFQPRRLDCAFCERKGNQVCSLCRNAVCSRHAKPARGFEICCPECDEPGAVGRTGSTRES
jgi:hypothetical protein